MTGPATIDALAEQLAIRPDEWRPVGSDIAKLDPAIL